MNRSGEANPGREPGRPAKALANALVVQFSDDTEADLTQASGRVEHLETGRGARFASASQLLECIASLLDGQRQEGPADAVPEPAHAPRDESDEK